MNITILNTAIKQDKKGLFCINDIHKASGNDKGKQPSNWLRLDSTQELIQELEDSSYLRSGTLFIIHLRMKRKRASNECIQ